MAIKRTFGLSALNADAVSATQSSVSVSNRMNAIVQVTTIPADVAKAFLRVCFHVAKISGDLIIQARLY